MARESFGRIKVDHEGDYSLYTDTLPDHCEVFGLIEILKTGRKGALIKLHGGAWQMIEGGRYTDLPEKKVLAAIADNKANRWDAT